MLGVFALGIGALIRHTAGAIATVIGLVLVLPLLTSFLPGNWGRHVNGYLPQQAGSLIYQARAHADQVLSPWQGFALFCAWTALLLGTGGFLLMRRDA